MKEFALSKKGRHGTRAGSFTRGKKTREAIIDCAMHIAASESLGAISIGRLAKELKITKSGLFIHFGSKEKLEEAVVTRASEIFFGHVLGPAEDEVKAGMERLWALCDSWLQFVEDRVLPGGYFFTGAFFISAEQHSFIAQRIREVAHEWVNALRKAVDEGRHRLELQIDVNARRTAFELNSLLLGAQWSRLLDHSDHSKAHLAILAKLKSLATEKIPSDVFDSVTAWRHYLDNRDS